VKRELRCLKMMQANDADYEFEVTCSYCEVYNELIFDLLIPNSGPLYLRYGPALSWRVLSTALYMDAPHPPCKCQLCQTGYFPCGEGLCCSRDE